MKPIKTNLIINVGITGHRDVDLDEKQNLKDICLNILEYISKCTYEYYYQEQDFYNIEKPKLCLISSLAEGFDQIAASVALECNYDIQCPLPFSKKDYIDDFHTEESRSEYLCLLNKASAVYQIDFGRIGNDEAYLNAGTVMLDYTDILLAFWDGKPSRGAGGTADIIELAEENGIPIICIDRNFTVNCNKNLNWKMIIRKYIERLIIPFDESDKNKTFPTIYFKEETTLKKGWQLYNNLLKLFSTKKKVNMNDQNSIMKSEIEDNYSDFSEIKKYFNTYEIIADNRAIYYSNQYHSAGIFKCIIPLLATIALALGFYWNWAVKENIINVIGFLLQAILLYIMARFIGINADKKQWHQKFIDYRILAECLRYKPFLMSYGITLRQIRIPAYNQNTNLSWINWYIRCIVRDYGLPNEKISEKSMNDILDLFRYDILDDQRNYHIEKAEKHKTIAHKLEKLSLLFFVLGAIVTLLRVIIHYVFIRSNIEWFPNVHCKLIRIPTLFNLLSLLFPAIGSVFAAIEAQAGFKRLSERHSFMIDQLNIFISEIDELENKPFLIKRKWITNVSESMINEVCDWRVFLKSKVITKK